MYFIIINYCMMSECSDNRAEQRREEKHEEEEEEEEEEDPMVFTYTRSSLNITASNCSILLQSEGKNSCTTAIPSATTIKLLLLQFIFVVVVVIIMNNNNMYFFI